jgi:hypothetical protein
MGALCLPDKIRAFAYRPPKAHLMSQPLSERLSVLLQYLLPKQALTALAGRFAGWQGGSVTTAAIARFVRRYGVNMDEAANPDVGSYSSFNEFFTRPLKASARPLAQAAFVSPVDGAISQCGPIEGDRIFQAKGHSYTTRARVTTTASTCRVPGASRAWCMCRAICSRSTPPPHAACRGCLPATSAWCACLTASTAPL